MKSFKIGNKYIGAGKPVLVIAEAGVNHNGDIRIARKLIDAAKKAGADAVKFQTFKTESIITKDAPSAAYHLRATRGKESWFELLKRLELGRQEHLRLFRYCKAKGIIFLSTPYDTESADFLHKLGVPAFKIASTDANNIPLIRHIASFGRPVILSTGLSTMGEIKESISAITKEGNRRILLLQCTANYPPDARDANLNVITGLRRTFGFPVGYSDHLASPQAAIAAVAKGACVYEVHFTLDRKMPGPDQKSSLEPQELARIVGDIRMTEKLSGSYAKKITASEKETRKKLRKSIVASRDILTGEKFSPENISVKRPGSGLAPKYFYRILGKRAKRYIPQDALLKIKDIA